MYCKVMPAVRVDKLKCITAGVCWSIAPDIFEYDPSTGKTRVKNPYRRDDTKSESVGEIPEGLREAAESATETCPTGSITVE